MSLRVTLTGLSLVALSFFNTAALGQNLVVVTNTNLGPPPLKALSAEPLDLQVNSPSKAPVSSSGVDLNSELGRYKAQIYRAVGSRRYPSIDRAMPVLPLGKVRIQYTIHADGSVETKVLEGDQNDHLKLLLSICLSSIQEAAPFTPFTDSLEREIRKAKGGDGRSYTDEFSFDIHGNPP